MENDMVVDFLNDNLKAICLESKKAIRIFGPESARKLQARYSDLKAVRGVSELIAGRPHPYKGKGEKRFSLDLSGGTRVLFVPTGDSPPRKVDGGLDWDAVTEVTIVFIGDNHDD